MRLQHYGCAKQLTWVRHDDGMVAFASWWWPRTTTPRKLTRTTAPAMLNVGLAIPQDRSRFGSSAVGGQPQSFVLAGVRASLVTPVPGPGPIQALRSGSRAQGAVRDRGRPSKGWPRGRWPRGAPRRARPGVPQF